MTAAATINVDLNEGDVFLATKWELLAHNKIPGFWDQFGQITCGDRKWPLGIAPGGVFCFTDLEHPDDKRVKRIYRLNPYEAGKTLFGALNG